jgi:hypothetical protein
LRFCFFFVCFVCFVCCCKPYRTAPHTNSYREVSFIFISHIHFSYSFLIFISHIHFSYSFLMFISHLVLVLMLVVHSKSAVRCPCVHENAKATVNHCSWRYVWSLH